MRKGMRDLGREGGRLTAEIVLGKWGDGALKRWGVARFDA